MKQWIKKHKGFVWTSGIFILIIGLSLGWFAWYRNKQIIQSKEDIQYVNRLLSEFHQQKTLYQKVDFLLHKLPGSDKESPFCRYGYDIDYPDNGWRDANPVTIEVSSTVSKYDDNGYEVVFIIPLLSKESAQHKKNICLLYIKDRSDSEKDYNLEVNNNWNVVKCSVRGNKKVSNATQEKLLTIGKRSVELLFKTVEKDMKEYKKRAENTLKYYHVSY